MITPTGHKVLVKVIPLEKKTDSGIIVDYGENNKLRERQQQLGVVAAVGPQAWNAFRQVQDGKEYSGQPWAKVGDVVYCSRMAGVWVPDPETGDEFVLYNDADIQCVISDGPNPEVKVPEYNVKVNTP